MFLWCLDACELGALYTDTPHPSFVGRGVPPRRPQGGTTHPTRSTLRAMSKNCLPRHSFSDGGPRRSLRRRRNPQLSTLPCQEINTQLIVLRGSSRVYHVLRGAVPSAWVEQTASLWFPATCRTLRKSPQTLAFTPTPPVPFLVGGLVPVRKDLASRFPSNPTARQRHPDAPEGVADISPAVRPARGSVWAATPGKPPQNHHTIFARSAANLSEHLRYPSFCL